MTPTTDAVPTKKNSSRRKTLYIFPKYNSTISALEQRIRRALKHQGEALRRTRGDRQEIDLGNYYVVDIQRNIIMQHHCSLVALARDLGVDG